MSGGRIVFSNKYLLGFDDVIASYPLKPDCVVEVAKYTGYIQINIKDVRGDAYLSFRIPYNVANDEFDKLARDILAEFNRVIDAELVLDMDVFIESEILGVKEGHDNGRNQVFED